MCWVSNVWQSVLILGREIRNKAHGRYRQKRSNMWGGIWRWTRIRYVESGENKERILGRGNSLCKDLATEKPWCIRELKLLQHVDLWPKNIFIQHSKLSISVPILTVVRGLSKTFTSAFFCSCAPPSSGFGFLLPPPPFVDLIFNSQCSLRFYLLLLASSSSVHQSARVVCQNHSLWFVTYSFLGTWVWCWFSTVFSPHSCLATSNFLKAPLSPLKESSPTFHGSLQVQWKVFTDLSG